MGNLGTLALGALLIIGVLFIGYKMDTSSQKSYKSKVSKRKKDKSPFREEYDEDDDDDIYPSKISSDSFEDDEQGNFTTKYDKYYEDDDTETYEYDNDYSQEYEADEINQSDLVEDNAYEEEDISFFKNNDDIQTTFDDDIDNNIAFETEEDNLNSNLVQEEIAEIEPEPIVEEVVPAKPKRGRGRPKKVKEPEIVTPEVVDEPEDDFSSTMVFDTEKLYGALDELDSMDKKPEIDSVEEPEDYAEPVYDIDDKISELEDENSEPVYDNLVQQEPDDAESFMNQLKRMQESAEAEDFSGFVVDNKDTELKEVHKKYTKKKLDPMEDISPISFIPEVEKKEDTVSSDVGMDMNFLEQMEKNLKATQKERLSKKKKDKDK